jgi:hypothetical protein
MLTQRVFDKIISSGYVGYIIPDSIGNQLIIHKDGNVGLKIKTENGRERNLGAILDCTLYAMRETKHIFIKSNSIGFNYHLLKDIGLFNTVILQLEQTFYQIPKDSIIQFGKIMNFKEASDDNDFDLQIFISLDILKNYEI